MEGRFLFIEEEPLRKIINEEVTNALANLLNSVRQKPKRIYTRFDVMEMFDISPATLDKMIGHGDLHAFKFGSRVFFDSEELDRDIQKFRCRKYERNKGGA